MSTVTQSFSLVAVEPDFVIQIAKIISDFVRLTAEAKIKEIDEAPSGQLGEFMTGGRGHWASALEGDWSGVSASMLSYSKGGRSYNADGMGPILKIEQSVEGIAAWIPTADVDSYQVLISSQFPPDIRVTVNGYRAGGYANVEVKGIGADPEVESQIDSLLNSFTEVASKYLNADANAEFSVFLGHGHGSDWKMLKQAIEEAGYPVLAFESAPRAGDVNLHVIEASIRSARVAVLHLTPDDEMASGLFRGRQNVVHEIGYAQGALGTRQVVIVQHEGVEMFSNLDGVSVVRYQANSLFDKLEEVVTNLNAIRVRPQNGGGK
jgi:predicted nucleotide-binding protein